MNQLICSAINNKRIIQLVYDWGHRIVEPHAYGLNTNGHELLRAYQTGGASQSHESVGWKLFRVDEIHSLHVLEESFLNPRAGYKRNDKAMDQRLYCQL